MTESILGFLPVLRAPVELYVPFSCVRLSGSVVSLANIWRNEIKWWGALLGFPFLGAIYLISISFMSGISSYTQWENQPAAVYPAAVRSKHRTVELMWTYEKQLLISTCSCSLYSIHQNTQHLPKHTQSCLCPHESLGRLGAVASCSCPESSQENDSPRNHLPSKSEVPVLWLSLYILWEAWNIRLLKVEEPYSTALLSASYGSEKNMELNPIMSIATVGNTIPNNKLVLHGIYSSKKNRDGGWNTGIVCWNL